jgi:hypothetical protein
MAFNQHICDCTGQHSIKIEQNKPPNHNPDSTEGKRSQQQNTQTSETTS